MKKQILMLLLLGDAIASWAVTYTGRVIDAAGQPIPFATVYLEAKPEVGTATGIEGMFTLTTDEPASSQLTVSFIGYQTLHLTLSDLQNEGTTIRLVEQPIALQEMVVAAKAPRIKNKRKEMSYLLYRVYNRMQEDFEDTPTKYHIVSDVRMNAENTPWGMEQMIADVVNIPRQGRNESDSIQFVGSYCKRFFQPQIRSRADAVLAGKKLDKNLRKAALEVDSGVVVHKSLWAMGNIRYDFEQTMDDVRNWCLANEGETEIVLTHTEKKNFLGIFKYNYQRHYILDKETLSVLRFSEELTMSLNVPFGYKFTKADLELLNLLNMSDDEIEKFRLRKANTTISLNTIYQRKNGHLYIEEKNLVSHAKMLGAQNKVIPIDVKATQRVTSVQPNATPFRSNQLSRRIQREIVEIY